MSAADAVAETWKRLFMFVALAAVVLVLLSATWSFYSYAGKVLEQRDARIQMQQAVASWSGTGNASGVIRLSEVSSDDLEPCTVVRIYYANGTLVKQVSTPCP